MGQTPSHSIWVKDRLLDLLGLKLFGMEIGLRARAIVSTNSDRFLKLFAMSPCSSMETVMKIFK